MIALVTVAPEPGIQEVREEYEFKHQEENDQFQDDDRPQFLPNRHGAKSVGIEEEYSL
jgi:hypothetical protein